MQISYSNYQVGQAHTHVLVIGVGKYPHLHGGDGLLTQADFGLGQLSSPPKSARHFADWLIANFVNDQAPLGSVDVLISEADGEADPATGNAALTFKSATVANVDAAFQSWKARCIENGHNIAIFYYCGDGVRVRTDQVLLAEDYGADDGRPFRGAVNLNKMIQGMASQTSGLQCFFIDACSDQPYDILTYGEPETTSLIQIQYNRPLTAKQLVLQAAVPGTQAYGQESQVSRFTKALVDGLNGNGCEPYKRSNYWRVTPANLVNAVYRLIDHYNRKEGGAYQIPDGHPPAYNGYINLQKDPPRIPVVIEFDPGEAIDTASMRLASKDNPAWVQTPTATQTGEYWEIENVEMGEYELEASFGDGRFSALKEEFPVIPPGPVPGPILVGGG